MNLTRDEKILLENYRAVKKQCQGFQPSAFSTPACTFSAGKGSYVLSLNAEFARD